MPQLRKREYIENNYKKVQIAVFIECLYGTYFFCENFAKEKGDMTFEYNSSSTMTHTDDGECVYAKRKLPDDIVGMLRKHLVDSGFCASWGRWQLQDCLLSFRYENNERLLINHLEPIFNYLATMGKLWPED